MDRGPLGVFSAGASASASRSSSVQIGHITPKWDGDWDELIYVRLAEILYCYGVRSIGLRSFWPGWETSDLWAGWRGFSNVHHRMYSSLKHRGTKYHDGRRRKEQGVSALGLCLSLASPTTVWLAGWLAGLLMIEQAQRRGRVREFTRCENETMKRIGWDSFPRCASARVHYYYEY